MHSPNSPLIRFDRVAKRYEAGPAALEDVSLTVSAGEALAVLGPSGSGKSTLLNLVAGLDRPSQGEVSVDGVRVDGLSEAGAARYRRARIGMVFQFFNLLEDLTVLDNVLLPAQLSGMARAAARERAASLLATLGIEAYAGAYRGRLSGGQRQRVAVARALMNRPSLLLADEPTGALDSGSAADVEGLLRELSRQGQTIVLVTHDERLARDCATRAIRLRDGRIVSDTGEGGVRGGFGSAASGSAASGSAAGSGLGNASSAGQVQQ